MKSKVIAAAVAMVASACFAADAKLQDGDRVAVLGDSITEQKNYSVLIEDYMLACQPAQHVQTAQFGWGGETTWGFAPRMAQDVLWYKPTVATIAYGMNDGGYAGVDQKRLDDYKRCMHDIVRQLKDAGARTIVVGGPGAVDTDAFRTFIARGHDDAVRYNKTLSVFGDAAEEVAKDEGVVYANLHNIMADAMVKFKQKYPDKSFVGPDGIHPDNVGHMVMAYAFLKAMGCDGDLGSITVDLTGGTAEATGGHKVVSADAKAVTIESSRYPFVAPRNLDPLNLGSAMDLVPFEDELNRMKLVVRNVPAGKTVHLTWTETDPGKNADGQPIKPTVVQGDFTAEQLASGINLAAAFPTTPFEHAFGRLDQAVHAQQDFETPLNKQWLHNQAAWSAQMPAAKQQFADLADSAKQMDEKLRAVSAVQVLPVKTTLTFEVR